jgi:hypothetical protein
VKSEDKGDQDQKYDRGLLLLGAKRNEILELWEVERYGIDSFGDSNYVSIYGRPPADWHANGARLLGRTVVECTRDALGDAIGKDVAAVAASVPHMVGALVFDPFAGSGNTLYWMLRHLPGARGLGFEVDPTVFDLTRRNVAALKLSFDIQNTDYVTGLTNAPSEADELIVAFIAPPWGDALSRSSGLDLRHTSPPISEIADFLFHRFAQNPLMCAIQIFETTDELCLAELRKRFDWSTMRIYDLNAPGENHGVLLGTRYWTTQAHSARSQSRG